jgi:hypothetical protein
VSRFLVEQARQLALVGIFISVMLINFYERAMDKEKKSLRLLIEKWLAPTPAMPVRVTRMGGIHRHRMRYVCVEASRPAGPLEIFFFRHDDGTWHVFPPEAERPAMSVFYACYAIDPCFGET